MGISKATFICWRMIKLDFKNAVRLTVIMNLLDEAGYFGKHTIITATVHNMHSISTLPFFIVYNL